MKYILASGSPRRKELLAKVIPDYEVIPAIGEEATSKELPEEIVEELSYQKASEIFNKVLTNSTDIPVVIGADTIVSYKRRVLGKPRDRKDAADMIRGFQGDSHAVYTGVTVFTLKDGKPYSFTFHEETLVDVAPMTEEEILSYVATGEADDKAGAYGVQGLFGIYITGIRGDYYNVVGLPIARLYHEMKNKELL